jgi:hypothetical protein
MRIYDTIVNECANLYVKETGVNEIFKNGEIKEGLDIKRYLPFDDKLYPNGSLRFIPDNPISRYANEVYYNDTFSDTIYAVQAADKVIPKYYIDFGEKRCKYDLRHRTGEETLSYTNKNPEGAFFVGNFFESPGFVHFTFRYYNDLYSCFYSKASKTCKTGRLKNDLFAKDFYFTKNEDDVFITVIKPYQLKELAKKVKDLAGDEKAKQKLLELTANMDANENEMLLTCRIKQF